MKARWGILLALVAAIGAGLAWRANFRLRVTRTAAAEAATTAARIATESARARQQLEQATARRAGIEQELAKLATVPRPPASATASVARRPSTPTELAIQVAQFKGRLAPRYSQFYREMKFTAEQAAKFEALLTEQEGRRLDLQATITGGTLTLSAQEVTKLRAEETARVETEQRQLLGDNDYEQLQAFRGSENHRRIVRELVSGLALSSSPLSVEQEGQLRKVLAELNFEDRAGADREHWDPVFERAGAFLSPTQMVELHVVATKSEGLWGLNELSRFVRSVKP